MSQAEQDSSSDEQAEVALLATTPERNVYMSLAIARALLQTIKATVDDADQRHLNDTATVGVDMVPGARNLFQNAVQQVTDAACVKRGNITC